MSLELALLRNLPFPLQSNGIAHGCDNSTGWDSPPSFAQADSRFCRSASIDHAESPSSPPTVLHRVNADNDIRRRRQNVYSAGVFYAAKIRGFPATLLGQSYVSPLSIGRGRAPPAAQTGQRLPGRPPGVPWHYRHKQVS